MAILRLNKDDFRTEPELRVLSDPELPAGAKAEGDKPSKKKSASPLAVLRSAVVGLVWVVWFPIRTVLRYLYCHPFHAVFVTILCSIMALLVITGSEFHDQMILNKISDQTVDRIIQGSRFTRVFDADEVATNGERDFAHVGAPMWMQRESVRAILFYARKAELPLEDQAALLAIADIESGFNPIARAPTSSACGLFQFVKKTGEHFGLSRAECMDPWENAKAEMQFYTSNFEHGVGTNVSGLSGTERAFRAFELSYYLHHDGPESSNPSNDVKATILSGSQVLFKSYHALLDEQMSQMHAPSFAESFSDHVWKVVAEVAAYFGYDATPFSEKAKEFLADQGGSAEHA